ncbi:chaperone protein DnaJ [Burkholderia pseudomallei]|nr:chaperone protein DnaJ [Burkholderia pseudomallei]
MIRLSEIGPELQWYEKKRFLQFDGLAYRPFQVGLCPLTYGDIEEMASRVLSEYGSAALIGMSPELLRHFASHRVKWKDDRKLAVAKTNGETYYFEEAELKAYDAWLRKPWPSKDGRRPTLPDAIREEIRREANLECALCKASGQAGEAAHIEPVANSKNNHPHNLIWLCANHHTKLDNGSFGPKGADNKVIIALKQALHHFQRSAWLGQEEVSRQIAATLSLCGEMKKQLKSARNTVEVEAVERVAKEALDLLPYLASRSKSSRVRPILDRMSKKLAPKGGTTVVSTSKRLNVAVSFEQEFLLESGLVRCPLCEGTKSHKGYDCPVCQGDGAVSKELDVDLTEFDEIECQLCEGGGHYNGNDCPVCGGEGRLERRFADRTDFSQYEQVPCPLCDGVRQWQTEDCPVCGGEGEMLRRDAEQVDITDFDEVSCPLCEGACQYQGDDCPECGGEGQMQARYANQVDLSKYERQGCPLCKGKGHYHGEDCPACGGEGQLLAGDVEQLDLAQYDLVNCPRCKGRGVLLGEDCNFCGGERKMQRRFAERLD